MITPRLIQHNSIFPISGDSPFTRRKLVEDIWKDGERTVVDEILKGSYTRDTRGLDEVVSSSEMTRFINTLQIPTLDKIGEIYHR